MLDFPRWKIWGISLLLALGVLFAIPSLVPEHVTRALPAWVPLPRVNLGLDLAGGSHLLLEADTDGLQRQRVATMVDNVTDAMRRADTPIGIGEVSTDGGRISFMVRDPGQVDAAVEKARALTTGVGVTGQRDWDVSVVNSTRIVLTPTPAGNALALQNAMTSAVDVVRRRIDALGTKEPTIVGQGTDRILVEVPGLQDPAGLKALLGKTAKLEFKMVVMDSSGSMARPAEVAPGQQVIATAPDSRLPPQIVVYRRAIVTGADLVKAEQSFDSQTNEVAVSFGFNGAGGAKFAKTTTANIGKPFAIIIDNVVISAPVIRSAILGGQGQITGSFNVESANQLAIQLRSGNLPVELKVIEERTVGETLGADAIHAGIVASVVAAVAVIAFMLLTYGRFGVYANIAVILNVFVILGGMALLNSTLTLPGIAGFVLTIGTAVDANVLIYERIREERRRGRNVVQAVELGYKEASRTIFEANVTHFIAGFVMLLLGSGPVKGFAIVLLFGIVTSVFTAVTFTRMLVALYIRRHRPTELVI